MKRFITVSVFVFLSLTSSVYGNVDSYLKADYQHLLNSNVFMQQNLEDFVFRNAARLSNNEIPLIDADAKRLTFIGGVLQNVVKESGCDLDENGKPDHLETWMSVDSSDPSKILRKLVDMIDLGTKTNNRMYNKKGVRSTADKYKDFKDSLKISKNKIAGLAIPIMDQFRNEYTIDKDTKDQKKKEVEDYDLFQQFNRNKRALRWLNPLVYLISPPLAFDIYYRHGLPSDFTFILKIKSIKSAIESDVLGGAPSNIIKLIKATDPNMVPEKLKKSEADAILSKMDDVSEWELRVPNDFLLSAPITNSYSAFLSILGIPKLKSGLQNTVDEFVTGVCQQAQGSIQEGIKRKYIHLKTAGTVNIGEFTAEDLKIGAEGFNEFIKDIAINASEKYKGMAQHFSKPDAVKKIIEETLPQFQPFIDNADKVCKIKQNIENYLSNPNPSALINLMASTLVSIGSSTIDAFKYATANKPLNTTFREKIYYMLETCKACFYRPTKQNQAEGKSKIPSNPYQKSGYQQLQEEMGPSSNEMQCNVIEKKPVDEKKIPILSLEQFAPIAYELTTKLAPFIKDAAAKAKYEKLMKMGACGIMHRATNAMAISNFSNIKAFNKLLERGKQGAIDIIDIENQHLISEQ